MRRPDGVTLADGRRMTSSVLREEPNREIIIPVEEAQPNG